MYIRKYYREDTEESYFLKKEFDRLHADTILYLIKRLLI